jgi:hypothetical protein
MNSAPVSIDPTVEANLAPTNLASANAPGPGARFRTGLNLLLWLWFGTVLALNIPGHLTSDSLIQIAEGRTGYVDSYNPLFSSWAFGNLVHFTEGTEVIVLLNTLMLTASIWMLVSAGKRPGLWVLVPCAALLFTPVLLVYPGVVWKDVWFAHSAALAFGLVMWRARGGGWWWEVPALLLLAVAMLSRQTGIIVCTAALVGLTLAAPAPTLLGRPLLGRALGFATRMMVLVLMASGLNMVAKASMKAIRGDAVGTGFQMVAIFDMAGILQRQPKAQLALLREKGFDTAGWEDAARRTFSAERVDTLAQPAITGPTTLGPSLVLRQWALLVGEYPGTYLAHRMETYAWFGGLRDQARCVPIHVGIDPPELAARAGVRPVPARWSAPLYAWSRDFLNTPYFAPVAWSSVSLLVLLVYAVRRQWKEPVAWMQVAGLLYSASYLAAGLSCDFRYSYFSVLAASVGLMRMLADGLSLPRSQHT